MELKRVTVLLVLVLMGYCSCGQKNDGVNKNLTINIREEYFNNLHFKNLSASAFSDKSRLSLSFQNAYLMKELMTKKLFFNYSWKTNLFSLDISHEGWSQMGEMTAALGYGKCFGRYLSVAFRFYYLCDYARGYDTRHSFTFDVSIFSQITEKLYVGVGVYNPAHLKYGVNGRCFLPMDFLVDIGCFLSNKVSLSVAFQKELGGAFYASLFGNVSLSRWLMLTVYSSVPQPSFGISVNLVWHSLRFMLASEYHFPLGLSPQCGLSFCF